MDAAPPPKLDSGDRPATADGSAGPGAGSGAGAPANPPRPPPLTAAHATLPHGTLVLGERFRILELVGRGGMGDVYLAEQVSLSRKVAIKLLREELGGQPGMRERFQREAQLLSTVDHPSIVRVIDFGETHGSYCLIMEYVDGETLAAAVRDRRMPVERALPLLVDVAEGLEAIHARGIVHRDLKLENVVLTRGPRGEQARLLDFGIARLVESDEQSPRLTQAGLVIGTPEVISPEQATGGVADPRSDVYSFGVLAFRVLTGELPFRGPTIREFLMQHLSVTPPRLEERVAELSRHRELSDLVWACLEKSPDARPSNGRALVDALEAVARAAGATGAAGATAPQSGAGTSPAAPRATDVAPMTGSDRSSPAEALGGGSAPPAATDVAPMIGPDRSSLPEARTDPSGGPAVTETGLAPPSPCGERERAGSGLGETGGSPANSNRPAAVPLELLASTIADRLKEPEPRRLALDVRVRETLLALREAVLRAVSRARGAGPLEAAFVAKAHQPGTHLRRVLRRIQRTTRTERAVAAGGLVVALFLLYSVDWTARRARALLEDKKPTDALVMLELADATPARQLLRVAALHRVRRHRAEWELVRSLDPDVLRRADSFVLEGLAEDYASSGGDEALRQALARLPEKALSALEDVASGPPNTAQWGAVRYLDRTNAADVDRVKLYGASLDSGDCEVRAVAARRLGELGDPRAVEPLERLRSKPRKPGFLIFDRDCGHAEAEEALARLSRPK